MTDYCGTVKRAAEQNGGYERLAERLGVSLADVTAWGDGSSTPPVQAMLRLVEIILEDTIPIRTSKTTVFGPARPFDGLKTLNDITRTN